MLFQDGCWGIGWTYSTPKLRIVAFGDHFSFTIRPQSRSDEVESCDQLLTVGRVESVFGAFAHCDDEDVAVVAVEGQVWLVDYRGGHSRVFLGSGLVLMIECLNGRFTI